MRNILILAVFAIVFHGMSSPIKSNIGAKNVEYTDEETESYSAASYIQDGLIAMWDAIENIGFGLHDDNATTWVDLT